MEKSVAEQVVDFAYSLREDGRYCRPRDSELRDEFGGRMISSSNDDEIIISFSPTDVWEFEDGSRVEIGYSDAEVIAGAAPRDRRKIMKTIKVPQTYVPARAVAPEDLALCQTFDSREPGSREVLAHLPLNKEVRLIEPVTMRFFDGGSVTLEGRVTLTRRGSPASCGEVEMAV